MKSLVKSCEVLNLMKIWSCIRGFRRIFYLKNGVGLMQWRQKLFPLLNVVHTPFYVPDLCGGWMMQTSWCLDLHVTSSTCLPKNGESQFKLRSLLSEWSVTDVYWVEVLRQFVTVTWVLQVSERSVYYLKLQYLLFNLHFFKSSFEF